MTLHITIPPISHYRMSPSLIGKLLSNPGQWHDFFSKDVDIRHPNYIKTLWCYWFLTPKVTLKQTWGRGRQTRYLFILPALCRTAASAGKSTMESELGDERRREESSIKWSQTHELRGYIRRSLGLCHNISPEVGWKWKWSNDVSKGILFYVSQFTGLKRI